MVEWLSVCQQLYNAALQHRRDAWEHEKRQRQYAEDRGIQRKRLGGPTYESQTHDLALLRHDDVALASVPSNVQRSALRRVDAAFRDFFLRCKRGETAGFPRFRARNRYDSFSIGRAVAQADGRCTRHARVHVPKLGLVRFHEYRLARGRILDVSIRRTAGRWYVCFACDLGDPPKKVAVRTAVGIDVGLATFATLSDGTEFSNPRCFRDGESQLARRQRSVARRQKGSRSRKRARLLVARAHEHTRSRRLDHARKLAAVLVAKYDLIAYEDLNIRGMVRGHFGKSINDAAWGQFIYCLICKAEEAGKWAVPVDPRGTTQRCSACGQVVGKTLSERTHACSCGLVLGRDENAARNILALGRSAVEGESLMAEGRASTTRTILKGMS